VSPTENGQVWLSVATTEKSSLPSSVRVVDQVFKRILFKSSVEFVGDYVLLAALSAFIRREQLKQVGAATGQDHPMGRNLPLAHLIDEQQRRPT
jgi:hypothetical protein